MNNKIILLTVIGFFMISFGIVALQGPVSPVVNKNLLSQLASDQERFTQLLKKDPLLTDELRTKGTYTVFAPTDTAWSTLPQATSEALNNETNKASVTMLLLYHIVPGTYSLTDLSDGRTLITLQGEKLHFSQKGSTIIINNKAVIKETKLSQNGITHVIDQVLVPQRNK